MKTLQQMSMDELRLAIELLEDSALAGHVVDEFRLAALRRERIKRVNAGLASVR